MVKKIVWTKRANHRFNAIVDYLETEWGKKVTENFIKRSFDIIELIFDHPEIGTLENPQKGIRGFRISKHNRLFYRINKGEIILLNFFDNRQDFKKLKY